jgi:PBP1b-binding outer membrane lipoprotein LpoB
LREIEQVYSFTLTLNPGIMKKKFFAIAAAALLLSACGGKAAKEAAAKAEAAEIEQLETVTSQIDSAITDIEEASMKVDTLLDEL